MDTVFSEEVRERIRRISAWSLPDDPTGRGWKPNEIRKTLYQPILELFSLLVGFENGYDGRLDEIGETVEAAQKTADDAQEAADRAEAGLEDMRDALKRLEDSLGASGGGLSWIASQALLDWMEAAGNVMQAISGAISGILTADLVYGTADESVGADELVTLDGISVPATEELPLLRKNFADALADTSEEPGENIVLSAGVLSIRALVNEPSLAGGVLSIR